MASQPEFLSLPPEFEVKLWPPLDPVKSFGPGDYVHVFKSNKPFAKGFVEEMVTDPESKFKGRCRIRYENDGSLYHIRPTQMMKIENIERKCIIVTEDTEAYRKVSKLQAHADDGFLEVGSSFGKATVQVHEVCKNIVGIDISQDHLDQARESYPDIQFEHLNLFDELGAHRKIAKMHRRLNFNKVMIDINGNRMMKAVVEAVHVCNQLINPGLIIVKSVELFAVLQQQAKAIAMVAGSAGFANSGSVAGTDSGVVGGSGGESVENVPETACTETKVLMLGQNLVAPT
eukprot:GFYU01021328.1.p1 GENE.GFYU01021328.1~~GFYU01021328.1.p1  ORF type:complete len:288 (-),score=73.93 GFYU01021328.1:162-1025(-)